MRDSGFVRIREDERWYMRLFGLMLYLNKEVEMREWIWRKSVKKVRVFKLMWIEWKVWRKFIKVCDWCDECDWNNIFLIDKNVSLQIYAYI